MNHLDNVLLSSRKLSRSNNLSGSRELREISELSRSRSRSLSTDQDSVRVLATAALRWSARAVLVIRVKALVLLLDLVCLLLVVEANLASLHVPASAKDLGWTKVSGSLEAWHLLLTNFIVGDIRTLVLDDLVTLLTVKDVGIWGSWDMDAVDRKLRTLQENRLVGTLGIQEHSTIAQKVARDSEIIAALLVVTGVENRLPEFYPGEENE